MDYTQSPLPAGVDGPARPAVTLVFTEGPAYHADGTVYFSDIINSRILKRAPDGTISTFREQSGRTNGNTFDREGRLLHCEGAEFGPGGNKRITRTDLATGKYEVLTDEYEGVPYNSPNDICVDGRGRIYFTDPMYYDRSRMTMKDEAVYRIDLDGRVTRIITQPQIERPNGVAATQDSRHLYVIDSCSTVGGARKVWSFDLDEGGNPSNQRVVWDFAPGRGGDGMRIDLDGNLWVAAGIMTARGPHETTDVPPAIYHISPQGKLLGRVSIPEDVITNLAFGGPDGKTVYVTAGKTLFTFRAPVAGQVAYPTWES